MEYEDFYRKLRTQVRTWAEGKGAGHRSLGLVLLAPDLVHLLIRMTLDERVDTKSKAKLGAALAYFVSPVDLLPEALLGPAGFADDVAVACLALHAVLAEPGNREVAREHWQGDEDLLDTIQRVLDAAHQLLGTKVWGQIQRRFGGR